MWMSDWIFIFNYFNAVSTIIVKIVYSLDFLYDWKCMGKSNKFIRSGIIWNLFWWICVWLCQLHFVFFFFNDCAVYYWGEWLDRCLVLLAVIECNFHDNESQWESTVWHQKPWIIEKKLIKIINHFINCAQQFESKIKFLFFISCIDPCSNNSYLNIVYSIAWNTFIN